MNKKVKVYATEALSPKFEVLFYVNNDGDVMKTERLYSSSLVIENEKWEKVNKLPLLAKFIGNYPISLY